MYIYLFFVWFTCAVLFNHYHILSTQIVAFTEIIFPEDTPEQQELMGNSDLPYVHIPEAIHEILMIYLTQGFHNKSIHDMNIFIIKKMQIAPYETIYNLICEIVDSVDKLEFATYSREILLSYKQALETGEVLLARDQHMSKKKVRNPRDSYLGEKKYLRSIDLMVLSKVLTRDQNPETINTKNAVLKIENNTLVPIANDTLAEDIVTRDDSDNFSSGMSASITGAASLNVLKSGDIMSGELLLPNGSIEMPSLRIGTAGLHASSDGLSLNTQGLERFNISSNGPISITDFAGAPGIIHNDALGNLSSSLIVNADISPLTAISDAKLATIYTAGKVSNSATTATNSNAANTIVARDASGNFSAGTIIANVTGASSLNVLKSGDTMNGPLLLPAGSTSVPALQIGALTTGISSPISGLSLSTSGLERFNISSNGTISLNSIAGTAGIIHNDASGTLSSSLIVDSDISATAAITDTKLSPICTIGKVANSATTATNNNNPRTIVARDDSGNFSAGTITAQLTGASSLNVLKSGDIMSGSLSLPTGSIDTPALQLGSSNIGLYASSSGFSLSTNGQERLHISANGVLSIHDFSNNDGIVHANASGILSSSLIGNDDISAFAAIDDTKLDRISTPGKVTNSATTATDVNTPNTIVSRDTLGNFSANTITAHITGSSSLNILKSGDIMNGSLLLPTGSAATPALQIGTTTIGLSSPANGLSLSTNGLERLNISPTGVVSVNGFADSMGIVHNDASGNLTSSLIINDDMSPSAAIDDTKLDTISTPGKVTNSATTATHLNTPNTIVSRDTLGNFSANIISANITGASSLNVLKSGDIMNGSLLLPTGSTATPALQIGAATIGFSSPANGLSLSTNGLERLNISPTGTVSINIFAGTAGVVHNDASGHLSSSLLLNADISPAAAITDAKLAPISTAGKVANSATTATSTNTPNTIVSRDTLGNFSASTITANVTGAASLNVLKTGDTLTGALTFSSGSAAKPAIQFTGSINTGFSAPTANVLSFDTNGIERMNISTTTISTFNPFITMNVICNQAIQTANPANSTSVTVNSTTSILLLTITSNRTNVTIMFPSSPVDGQLLSIVIGSTNSITLINNGNGATIVNGITSLNPTASLSPSTGGTAVTYYYSLSTNSWYRLTRG